MVGVYKSLYFPTDPGLPGKEIKKQWEERNELDRRARKLYFFLKKHQAEILIEDQLEVEFLNELESIYE
jgi:hypothetical protein